MNINLKEPATVLAIMLIFGMIVGPWFAHDRTLVRNEARLVSLEERMVNLQARMAGAETTLNERRLGFEEALRELRRGKFPEGDLPEWPTPHPKH